MQWVCDRACGPGEASSGFYWDTTEAPLNGQEKLATEDAAWVLTVSGWGEQGGYPA